MDLNLKDWSSMNIHIQHHWSIVITDVLMNQYVVHIPTVAHHKFNCGPG